MVASFLTIVFLMFQNFGLKYILSGSFCFVFSLPCPFLFCCCSIFAFISGVPHLKIELSWLNLVPCHEALSLCPHFHQLTASYEAIALCIRSILFNFLAPSIIKKTSAPWLHAENLAPYLLVNGAPLVLISLSYSGSPGLPLLLTPGTQQTHSFNPDFRFFIDILSLYMSYDSIPFCFHLLFGREAKPHHEAILPGKLIFKCIILWTMGLV